MSRRVHIFALLILGALAASVVAPAVATTPEPTVSIAADRSFYVAGQTAHLAFAIDGPDSQTHIKIVATFSNGQVTTLRDLDWNTGDTMTFDLYELINSRIDAYVGTPTPTVPSATFNLAVKPSLFTQAPGYHVVSGSYVVFARQSAPQFLSTVYPMVSNRCLRHVVQRHYASGWRNSFFSACRSANSQGQVSWTWHGRHATRVKYRVRASFAGDSRNRPAVSAWKYFKIV